MDTEQTNATLERMLGILRRRAPWILLCLLLLGGAAYGLSKQQTKKYTATASLVFPSSQPGQRVADLKLVQFGDMAAKTSHVLGRGLTNETVHADVSVSAQRESDIVKVAATTTSPALAAEIANTYSGQVVAEQQSSEHARYTSALKLVDKRLAGLSAKQRAGSAGLALRDRARSLGALAGLRSGNVQVAQAATAPTAPSSPRIVRNTVLGAVLGLLLGLGVAFLLERFRRPIREPEELQAIYGLPLLGVVPESAALSRTRRGRSTSDGDGNGQALPLLEEEAFNLIRAHLRYFNHNRELGTLLVSSAASGDGRTTVARRLASSAARMDSRVLLVEADLRHPTVAQQLDVEPGPGLSDVLIGALSSSEATQTIDLDSAGHTLDVLVAGGAVAESAGILIESNAMEAVLERARSMYDLVVIDTPPLAAVSDAFPLLRKVDGVIIVGRMGRNRRRVAERLHETLMEAGAPLLGVVANRFTAHPRAVYTHDNTYPQAKPPAGADVSANGVNPSLDDAALDVASANGAFDPASAGPTSVNGTPTPEAPMPPQPAHPIGPTYGEAVDPLGILGDLQNEQASGEKRRARRRRASRRS